MYELNTRGIVVRLKVTQNIRLRCKVPVSFQGLKQPPTNWEPIMYFETVNRMGREADKSTVYCRR